MVIGGNSGIGETTRDVFAGEGARVILIARHEDEGQRAVIKVDGGSENLMSDLKRSFVSRGLVILPPEALGIGSEIHDRIFTVERDLFRAKKPVNAASVPDILTVLSAPGLVTACNELVGENWAIVPHTHNTPFLSGSNDQHWHKDDNGPLNGRKQRHHQAVQIEMLYYPQAVTSDMGPTATIPYSHYWTFNHEENQDNFAGADHMDFAYQLNGMERHAVSGPHSEYARDEIVERRTAHDLRMRQAVADTGWPLVTPYEVAPLSAGSVVLYSHNLFHRGNHRRDEWQNWRQRPRFMWRFWLYRTTEPACQRGVTRREPVAWTEVVDELTGVDLAGVSADVTAIWDHQYHWLQTGETLKVPDPQVGVLADALGSQLWARGEQAEPERIGAAYRLASMSGKVAVHHLEKALYSERESVRRAASYGFAALGSDATDTLLTAIESPRKWVRRAAAFGLGDAADLQPAVLDRLRHCLLHDESVFVRSVSAGAMGCLGRRAIGHGVGDRWISQCVEALVQSLDQEDNRPGMDRAQKRSIKFVRPTDDSDICEGIGVDYGFDRFAPVRSAVRENALWSLVILCSHGTRVLGESVPRLLDALEQVIEHDPNVFSVGLALDALNRVAHAMSEEGLGTESQDRVQTLLRGLPLRNWESLLRTGFEDADLDRVRQWESKDQGGLDPGN